MTSPPTNEPPSSSLMEAVQLLTRAAMSGIDWAEFVTLACAGAAANAGGIHKILAVRPNSWQAIEMESLLSKTLSASETTLWEHRTDPIEVSLVVEYILTRLGDKSMQQYAQARAELEKQFLNGNSAIAWDRYGWTYYHNSNNEWVSDDPDAPEWSQEDWLSGLENSGVPAEQREFMSQSINQSNSIGQLVIPKYPGALLDLDLAEQSAEEVQAHYAFTLDQLEQQFLREKRIFGAQLAERLLVVVPSVLPGLKVPVNIRVVAGTADEYQVLQPHPLLQPLLDAVTATSGFPTTPDALAGTPLQRLAKWSETEPGPISA